MAEEQTGEAPGTAAGAGVADGMRQASERMQAAGGQMMNQGAQLGLKMLEQAEANTQEAFRAMRSAAQAHDATEIMRIQNEFLREQSTRAIGQAREIGDLIANFGRATIGQMTGRS